MAVERALVVGGGIAGLALAAGLARDGVDCEVVELAERWAPVGAGIVLSVNAMRVVRELGLEAAMRERGFALGRGAITDASGRDLLASDFGSLEPGFGPTVALHRADLHEVLLAGARGVPIALGTTLAALHQDPGGVDVRLSDGRERRYDLVVGADGVRSRVRTLAFGAVSLRYSGATSWRLVVEAPARGAELREMWGRGQRFGVVPIGGGRIYAYATANAGRGVPDPAAGRAERFRERFAAFGGQVPEILARVERADQLIHADLEDLVFEPWWRGRVVLIGDAAHAMTPNMGQGAAMALEDVAVLREELRRGSAPEALPRFAGRRRGRVRWVQRQSWRLGRVGQWRGSLACRLRDAVLRAIPGRANEAALRRLASQPL